jgi:methyl-accepting chemotaxis protein
MATSSQKQFRLRHWILVGYSIPIVALTISAASTIYNVRQVKVMAENLERTQSVSDSLGQVAVNLQITSRATRGYLLSPNQDFLNTFESAQTDYLEQLQEMEALVQDSQQKKNIQTLKAEAATLDRSNIRIMELARQGKVAEAIALWKTDEGAKQADVVSDLLGAMQSRQLDLVQENTQAQNLALDNLQRLVVAASASSVLFSIFLGTWIINKASRQMLESSGLIASSTTEIAATVEQQERTAQQQAASVNETTTTMDELGASSRQSAEQAEAAAAGARQALALAEGGTRAVDRTLQGMDNLMEKVQAISDQILRLSEQTSQIGSISGLVSDLANQTNMLALNAAVEAVRAGEHGKGFAVVSGEIRKLADQSKKSAEKINALVQDIQNAINSTVMATDEGSKTVEEGVRIAQETATAFTGVTDAVNNVVLNSQQISFNVKQQATAIQQVVTAMNNLNVAARENASGVSQVRLGTQRLQDAAINLKEMV